MAQKESYAPPSSDSWLSLRYAGEEDCLPGHRYGGVRDHVLFHYIVGGEGRVWTRGASHRLGKGSGFVFFPGQEHEYRASRDDPWHYLWMGFSGSGAAPALAACGIAPESSAFSLPESFALASLFRRARAHLEEGGALSSLAADACLRLSLAQLADMRRGVSPGNPGVPRPGTDYVDAARRFMEEHFIRPIDTADVARHIGLDRSYLSELFSRATGTSLKRYLTGLRMERSRSLLAPGRLSVAQVAASVGYRDPSVFSRRFKLETGHSPADFQRSAGLNT